MVDNKKPKSSRLEYLIRDKKDNTKLKTLDGDIVRAIPIGASVSISVPEEYRGSSANHFYIMSQIIELSPNDANAYTYEFEKRRPNKIKGVQYYKIV